MKKISTFLRIIALFPFLVGCNEGSNKNSGASNDTKDDIAESEANMDEEPTNTPFVYNRCSTSIFARLRINEILPGLYYDNKNPDYRKSEIILLDTTMEYDLIGNQKEKVDVLLPVLVGKRIFKELDDGTVQYYGDFHLYEETIQIFSDIDESYFFILQTALDFEEDYWASKIEENYFDENGNGAVFDKPFLYCRTIINIFDSAYQFLRMKDDVLQEDVVVEFIKSLHDGMSFPYISDYWINEQFPSGINREEVESRIEAEMEKAHILY